MNNVLYILGYIWAFPVTVLGWVWSHLGGVEGNPLIRPHGHRVYVATKGGLNYRWFTKYKFAGYTLGAITVVCSHEWLKYRWLLEHEFRHTQQCFVFGIFDLPLYALSSLICWIKREDPYWDNVFEKDAVNAEKKFYE